MLAPLYCKIARITNCWRIGRYNRRIILIIWRWSQMMIVISDVIVYIFFANRPIRQNSLPPKFCAIATASYYSYGIRKLWILHIKLIYKYMKS